MLDKATANVDFNTEHTIQDLMNQELKDSTMITIAHRLSTVMKSDKIMVMSFGEVVEFDTPQQLMSDPESRFSQLLREGNL